MSLPEITSRDEWLVARRQLLQREKERTRAADALKADRRRLPMVRIDKPYVFQGRRARSALVDLFEGRRQLILQHFMFDPSWEDGCPSCSAGADELSAGLLGHLHARDTTFASVARAPLDKIERYKARKGWTHPFYSSHGSDFNYDFHATIDESVAPLEVNYRTRARARGVVAVELDPHHGAAVRDAGHQLFLRDSDDVFHTYATYARGTEELGGAYAFLDLTALGRQEDWEEPKGRAADPHGALPNFAV